MDHIGKILDDYATACESLWYLWQHDVEIRIRYKSGSPPRDRVKRLLNDCLRKMAEEWMERVIAQIEKDHAVDYEDVPCHEYRCPKTRRCSRPEHKKGKLA